MSVSCSLLLILVLLHLFSSFFFFNDTATTEIYTLSLHDALPISQRRELREPHPRGVEQLEHRQVADFREPARARPVVRRDEQDRKSTRLNSSHGYISYAVFCLKKKKKNKKTTSTERRNAIQVHIR